MTKIKLQILGISNSQTQTGAYALILGEVDGNRRLPIIIGGFEAQAIAIELEGLKPNRPLTHDLIKSMAEVFQIRLMEVVINQFHEGVFYARLVCQDTHGDMHEIDSRTSDAVALAVRFGCDIYADESVILAAGIELPANILEEELGDEEGGMSSGPEETPISSFSDLTEEELEEMLDDMIRQENYEKASLIRDELKRRKK